MDIQEAIKSRHSVRSYTDKKIEGAVKAVLEEDIEKHRAESGLDIRLIADEPEAFGGLMSRCASFKNCRNYIVIAAKDGCDEAVGYYGEKLVLEAQALGLGTCWTALTYSKGKIPFSPAPGEKVQIVIAVGYGETQGVPHKSKSMEALCKTDGEMPDWFRNGMEAAMLAPTAVNQQKFLFTLAGGKVSAKAGMGFYSKMDLGIAKYHFETGAGKENFEWA